MGVPLRRSYRFLLLCIAVIFLSHKTDGNQPSHALLKAIAKMIERYERGELTTTVAIHYDHGAKDQNIIETLFLPGIIIWDPLFQYFHGHLPCPECGKNVKPRHWKDGKDWKHNSPRQLADIECHVLLVSRVYACQNDHRTVGHDPKILKEFANEELVPFLLLHKNGITRRLYRLLTVHTASGTSYIEVEALIRQMWHSYHAEVRLKALTLLRQTNSNTLSSNATNMIPQVSTLNPNRKLIRQCFVHDYYTKEKLYNIRMSSFKGSWLCSDHTFKVACNVGMWQNGQWIRQFDSLFSVMNEDGIVLAWQLTRGTGFARVKALLNGIWNRLTKSGVTLQGFSVDNCCTWRLLLQGVFGVIPIKLDLFHAVQRIASKIKKKHPLRKNCLDSFRLVFRRSGDIEKERKQLTPSREVMLANLDRFVQNWKNVDLAGEEVLPQKALDEIDKLKVHVKKGCLEDIPPKAGTSRQESMHKSLRKSSEKRRVGVKSAVASIGTCLYRWNEKRLSEKMGLNHLTVSPVSQYQDSILDIEGEHEEFGTGMTQKSSKFSEQDDWEDSTDTETFQNDSNSSSSEDGDNETDGHDSESAMEDLYHRVVEYALYLKSLAQSLHKKCEAPTMTVNLTQFTGRNLLLFSSRKNYSSPDTDECNARLTSVLKAFGFGQLPMPGDGDCFFHCISSSLSLLMRENANVASHLKSIGLCNDVPNKDRVIILRRLIVEEFTGPNRHLYEPFLVTSTDSYDTETQKFYEPGHYDSELGNCVPMAMSNILQVPLVIFTSMENYPITHVIPRARVLSKAPIYLGYIHSGNGHYNLLVEETNAGSVSTTTDTTVKEGGKQPGITADLTSSVDSVENRCSCGRGAAGMKRASEFCKTYQSRCPCFRAMQSCNRNCSCRSCKNPHGINAQEKNTTIAPLPRKRVKQDFQQDVKQTDSDYMKSKAEEPIVPSWLEDELFVFEALMLYLLVSNQDISPQKIYTDYHKIVEFCAELTSLELCLRPKSFRALSQKIQGIKAKLLVDEEFFKTQIQYNWFRD